MNPRYRLLVHETSGQSAGGTPAGRCDCGLRRYVAGFYQSCVAAGSTDADDEGARGATSRTVLARLDASGSGGRQLPGNLGGGVWDGRAAGGADHSCADSW